MGGAPKWGILPVNAATSCSDSKRVASQSHYCAHMSLRQAPAPPDSVSASMHTEPPAVTCPVGQAGQGQRARLGEEGGGAR